MKFIIQLVLYDYKNIRCKVTKISQTEGKKMSFLFRGAIIKTKSKLSDMAKFILTYPKWSNVGEVKVTKVERYGKIYFDISGSCESREKRKRVFFSEMQQRRRSQMKLLRPWAPLNKISCGEYLRRKPKIRKFLKPREKKMNFLFQGAIIKAKPKLSDMVKFYFAADHLSLSLPWIGVIIL